MPPQPSPAALFDKVELRGQDDLRRVESLLDEAVDRYMQAKGEAVPQGLRDALRSISANVMTHVNHFVACGDDPHAPGALLTPSAAPRSPQLQPLSPPPVDEEVQRLEAQVEEASSRLAALRAGMQAQLSQQLAARLAQCRPSAAADPPRPDAAPPAGEGGGGGDDDAPPSPRAEVLGARLAEAAGKLPELRARLEGADGRLQRVLAALAADLSRPPPNTVERLVMGRKTPAAPTLHEALAAGQIATRRGRESKPLHPLPYPEDDDDEDDDGAAAGEGQ